MQLLLPDLNEFHPGTMPGIKERNGGAAILRMCYGTAHLDQTAPPRRAAALSLGFRFLGLYQYLRKDQGAHEQALAFCRSVGKLHDHEVPILDLEEREPGEPNQLPRALEWMATVHHELRMGNELAWVYSDVFFAIEAGLAGLFNGTKVHTWAAAFGRFEPALGHTLWQCTDGVVGSHITDWPGAGRCDTSLYHGSLDQLALLTGHQTHPTPAPGGPMHEVTTNDKTRSLAEFCHNHGTTPASVLRHTAVHDGAYPPDVADYINAIFHGRLDVNADMPPGMHLWLAGHVADLEAEL